MKRRQAKTEIKNGVDAISISILYEWDYETIDSESGDII